MRLRRLALLLAAPLALLGAGDPPPNIVFVVSDDHSVPHLGVYGFPVATPNFDRFAAEGIAFSRMFTTAPTCASSRSSYATGRSAVAARTTRFTAGVPREVISFPEILRAEAGYFTGICRRHHHLDGWQPAGATLSPGLRAANELSRAEERFDWLKMGGRRTDTPAYIDEFLDQVPADSPFFLWINFNDPHHPWNAPAVNDPARLPLPAEWPDLPGLRQDFAHYLDEIVRLDEEFQWVLDALARRGLADNTLVVFVGDNGYALPRGKGALHDKGLNVPLLMRWPGRITPGQFTTELVSGEDFGPTFLAAAGLPVPPEMTGHNLLPRLLGDPNASRRETIFAMRGVHGSSILSEATVSSGVDFARCVRSERYKLILNYLPWVPYGPIDSYANPGWLELLDARAAGTLDPAIERAYFATPRPLVEFYDLQNDPAELHNLAGDPAVADAQRALTIALQEKMIVDYDYLPLPLRE